jgi:hypothetical protein
MSEEAEKKAICGCGGFPEPGVLCGYVFFSSKKCGADKLLECPYKKEPPKEKR